MASAVNEQTRLRATPYFAVAIIALVLLLNHADRLILGLMVEPIRREFQLSDTEIGLLTGPAFALVYALLVIPIARLAERRSRVIIVTLCLLVWSAATVACGLAGSFVTLVLARLFVGCGEAGGIAPSMSIVSDLFPAHRRATAMGLFGLGASAAIVLTPLIGGALIPTIGWRGTLFVLGCGGGLTALALILGVREPQRGKLDGLPIVSANIEWRAALTGLLARRSYVLFILAYVFVTLAQFALLFWLPAFFQRSYGVSAAELGAKLSLYQGAPLLAGNIASGFLADWLARRDQRWMAWMPMFTALFTAPIVAAMFAVHNEAIAFVLLAGPSLLQGLSVGPSYALSQNLAPIHSRATATAVLAFCVTVVGAGLGPLLLGILSELLSARFGQEGLRYAFFAISPFYAIAAAVLYVMSQRLKPDLEDVQRESLAAQPGSG